MLGQYLQQTHDTAILRMPTCRGPLYQSVRDFIVKPLLANLQSYGGGEIVDADASIWEEREKDKKHFAFSTAMAIVGLRNFAEVAQLAGVDNAAADHDIIPEMYVAVRCALFPGKIGDPTGALPIVGYGPGNISSTSWTVQSSRARARLSAYNQV